MQPANHMDVTPHILGLTFSSRRGWNPQGRTVCFIGRAPSFSLGIPRALVAREGSPAVVHGSRGFTCRETESQGV